MIRWLNVRTWNGEAGEGAVGFFVEAIGYGADGVGREIGRSRSQMTNTKLRSMKSFIRSDVPSL